MGCRSLSLSPHTHNTHTYHVHTPHPHTHTRIKSKITRGIKGRKEGFVSLSSGLGRLVVGRRWAGSLFWSFFRKRGGQGKEGGGLALPTYCSRRDAAPIIPLCIHQLSLWGPLPLGGCCGNGMDGWLDRARCSLFGVASDPRPPFLRPYLLLCAAVFRLKGTGRGEAREKKRKGGVRRRKKEGEVERAARSFVAVLFFLLGGGIDDMCEAAMYVLVPG